MEIIEGTNIAKENMEIIDWRNSIIKTLDRIVISLIDEKLKENEQEY